MPQYLLVDNNGNTICTADGDYDYQSARSVLWSAFLKKYRKPDDSGWQDGKPCNFHECEIKEPAA